MEMNTNISLCIVGFSYNSQDHALDFLKSIASQTMLDFDLIILDDGSKDNTISIIEHFKYPRLTLHKSPFNMGINAGLQKAIEKNTADIVCLVALDDMLNPNYVEEVRNCFNKNSDATVCYVGRQIIDRNAMPTEDTYNPPANKSAHSILYELFFLNNIISAPGMALRRCAFESLQAIDTSILNYSDLDWHVNMLFSQKICMTPKKVVTYRLHHTNLSQRSPRVIAKEESEVAALMKTFVSNLTLDTFSSIFSHHPVFKKFPPTNESLHYCIGQMALASPHLAQRKWAYQALGEVYSSRKGIETIYRLYKKDFASFNKQAEQIAPNENPKIKKLKGKIRKYKLLSIALMTVICVILLAYVLL